MREIVYSPFSRSPASTQRKKLRFFRSSQAIHYDGKKAYKFNGEKWVRTPEYDVRH